MLVVLMCITAAPLNGFAGLDLGFNASALVGTNTEQTQEYKLGDNITGTPTVFGEGAVNSFASGNPPLKDKADSIKKVVISDGVTSVGSHIPFWVVRALRKSQFPTR